MTKRNHPGNTMVGSISRMQATVGPSDRFLDIGEDHLVEVAYNLPMGITITPITTIITMATISHTPVNTLTPRIIRTARWDRGVHVTKPMQGIKGMENHRNRATEICALPHKCRKKTTRSWGEGRLSASIFQPRNKFGNVSFP